MRMKEVASKGLDNSARVLERIRIGDR